MSEKDPLEPTVQKVLEFHARDAPGVVIGCYMVDLATELLGPTAKLNAVVETPVCLADCIQYMTHCTLGNKDLRVWGQIGRYACTLYDRSTGDGVRVYLDVNKIDRAKYPELWAFHMRKRDPRCLTDMAFRKASGQKVVAEFLKLKRDALSHQRVKVTLKAKEDVPPSVPCSRCGEPFLTSDTSGAAVCGPCTGDAYYVVKA